MLIRCKFLWLIKGSRQEKKLHPLSERIVFLDIMVAKLRDPLKPFHTIVLSWSEGFQAAPIIPRGASLSVSYTYYICLIAVVFPVWTRMSYQESKRKIMQSSISKFYGYIIMRKIVSLVEDITCRIVLLCTLRAHRNIFLILFKL